MRKPLRLGLAFAVLGLGGTAARHPGKARWSPPSLGNTGYEVQLAFIGYTGLATSSSCDAIANRQGYDSLVGTVKGFENPAEPDADVVYVGTLKRKTTIDYCLTRPKSPATPDELVWCVDTLTAAATMEVELTVYGEDGNGAWLKAKPIGNADSIDVKGTCDAAETNQIRQDYPGGESAGSPDGQPIAELGNLKLAMQGIRRLRLGYFPPSPPETAWGLRVTRAVP
jgi:hypothetical protein